MGTDRTWLIRKNTGKDLPLDSVIGSIVGPDTEPVSVVEESRLREAEAERDRLDARLTTEPKRSKVVCPRCKRSLADVIDSLIRQRGKFKAQRIAAEKRAREAEAEVFAVKGEREDFRRYTMEAEARVEWLEAELREAREALTDIVKLGTSYQRYLHRQLPGQPPPDPHYHDEPVYSPEARRARGVLEKGTGNTERA
jgi:chromosome segregation ATPase